jgi:methionyl-tRNA formyltransferase
MLVVSPGSVRVACGQATSLELVELQPAGKRRMNAADFLRGNPLPPNSTFGPDPAGPRS